MTLSLAEFRERIRAEMIVDLNGLIWDNDDLDAYIKLAHRKVQQDFNFGLPENVVGSYLFVTSPGVLEYALPADYAQMQLAKLAGSPLGLTDKVALKFNSDLTTQGKPSKIYVYGRDFGFDMVPDSSYSGEIMYKLLVPPPTETTGSVLPDDVNRPIIMYSKYLCWNSPSGKAQDASQALAGYNNEINMLRMQYGFFNPTSSTWRLQRR